jgi:MFS family permease
MGGFPFGEERAPATAPARLSSRHAHSSWPSTAYPALVFGQILSGVTGAVIGVLTVIVVADLTAGTGRFNLATGTLGALSGITASLSTSGTGFVFQVLGPHLGYLLLAIVAALATLFLWMFLNETKPEKYED